MASTISTKEKRFGSKPSAADPGVIECSWIFKVLQPGNKLYDGHGVARPSAFVGGSGQGFIRELEVSTGLMWRGDKICESYQFLY